MSTHAIPAAPTVRSARAVQRIEAVSLRGPLPPASATMVSLAQGEPDFTSPAAVNAALVEAVEGGWSHYAPGAGDNRLRDRIAVEVSQLSGREVSREEVLVTHGGTGGLATAILGLVDPGDRVVVPDPTYSLYADLIAMAGGVCVRVPLADDLHWDFGALADALVGAKMFVFCNPGNPTGIVHSGEELRRLAQLLEGTDTLVLADEAYGELVFGGREFTSAVQVPELFDRTLYCQTFSKKYAMTGWRLGYLTGPAAAVAAASRVHATINGSINTAVQRAAVAALDETADDVAAMVASYAARRDLVMRELADVPQLQTPTPEGAFYVFPKYTMDMPSVEVVAHLRAHGVSTRPGSEYGPAGEGRIRLSYAASAEDIVEGVRRMRVALAELG
ncbi:pyridoxal phosphate-dependent aminotransferase [Kineococcus sp. SYSU DK003]|uniref:pyridoxal phosphate-dependent aminotransferase n=1 Tax=Kineococcus sp. SYSU DK003 TaxID=3383124 RepID=UPI003D7E73F9